MKVIIVDDHPLVRMGVEMVLEQEEDIQVAGLASNGREALELISREKPDVVLMDLRMPGEHGLEILDKARRICRECKYIILTSYATEEEISRSMEMNIDGYILKEALPEEFIVAVRLVHNGKKYYDPVVVQYAFEEKHGSKKNLLEELTPREFEVLGKLAQGLSNKEIAGELVISEHTVKKHIGQILDKLDLKDRTQAALFAASQGINGCRKLSNSV